MKKTYETPIVEKIAFNYRDQVVAASGAKAGCVLTKGGPNDSVCNGKPGVSNNFVWMGNDG